MKRLIAFLIIFLAAGSVFAQVDFYGAFSTTISASIPEPGTTDPYVTALNPGNIFGLKDVLMSNSLVIKMSSGDEPAGLDLWFSLGRYPVGEGLYAAAIDGGAPPCTMVSDFIAYAGDTIFTLNLQRAGITFYVGDNLRVKLGRQSMLTGYGYGWNPINFANPLKDPSDPYVELKGVDAVLLQLFPFSPVNIKIYGLVDMRASSSGVDYKNLQGGGEITISLPMMEWKITGIYDYDDVKGEDGRASAIGTGLIVDVAGIGLYGEAVLLDGSRNQFSDGALSLNRKDEPLVSALAGLEYTFANELFLILEYFYNGEGYDKQERENYVTDLIAIGMPTAEYYFMYRPGYFSRHYALLNLFYPLYEHNVDLTSSGIFSADSGTLSILSGIIWNASGNFSLELMYSGMFSLYKDSFNEAALSPVRNAFHVTGKFSF